MSTAKPAKLMSCAVLGVAAAAALGLSGCGAGQVTQTDSMVAAVPGTSTSIVDDENGVNIGLRDIVVEHNEAGYEPGDSANLVVRIFNNGQKDDKLVGVTTKAADSVVLADEMGIPEDPKSSGSSDSSKSSDDGSADPSNSPEPSGDASSSQDNGSTEPDDSSSASPDAGSGKPVDVAIKAGEFALLAPGSDGSFLQLKGVTKPLTSGKVISVTFEFENAGKVTMDIPVSVPPKPSDRQSADLDEGE